MLLVVAAISFKFYRKSYCKFYCTCDQSITAMLEGNSWVFCGSCQGSSSNKYHFVTQADLICCSGYCARPTVKAVIAEAAIKVTLYHTTYSCDCETVTGTLYKNKPAWPI